MGLESKTACLFLCSHQEVFLSKPFSLSLPSTKEPHPTPMAFAHKGPIIPSRVYLVVIGDSLFSFSPVEKLIRSNPWLGLQQDNKHRLWCWSTAKSKNKSYIIPFVKTHQNDELESTTVIHWWKSTSIGRGSGVILPLTSNPHFALMCKSLYCSRI